MREECAHKPTRFALHISIPALIDSIAATVFAIMTFVLPLDSRYIFCMVEILWYGYVWNLLSIFEEKGKLVPYETFGIITSKICLIELNRWVVTSLHTNLDLEKPRFTTQ